VAIALAAVSAAPGIASAGAALVSIALEQPAEGQLRVAADVVGLTDVTAHVTLTVEKSGPAGHATIEQAQDVTLTAGARRRAATLTVSFAPGDWLSATATLAVDGTIISTATTGTSAAGPGETK
jgi:hypothetical protein